MANHKLPAPSWLTADYMATILREAVQAPGLEVLAMKVTPGSTAGDNYACQIFRIELDLNINNQETHLAVIGKYKPETKLLDSLKDQLDVFEVESRFFTSTLPILRSIIHSHDDFAPKCYYVDLEKSVIFLEDLVKREFKLQPRGVFLNKDQCKLTLEALATLHGASYYAIQKDPSLKTSYRKGFWSSERNDPSYKFFKNAQKSLEKFIGLYDLEEADSKYLLGLMDRLNIDWVKVCDLQEDRLNFLLHGDSWMNNMMYHMTGGVADDVKLLDFQIVNYNCFANDLQYFIFTSVSIDVILNDLDNLLKYYYQKLKEVAPDIPNLTEDRVKTEFAERYYFGYLMAIVFRACMLSEEPPDMEDVLEDKVLDMGFNDPRYISEIKQFLSFFRKVKLF